MRCAKAAYQLQLYIDQQLTLEQVRDLENHLADCGRCREELFLLQEVTQSIQSMEMIAEPADLTITIMRRVATVTRQKEHAMNAANTAPLRPSLSEILIVVLLATISTLGVIMGIPTLRNALPIGNGHDALSMVFINFMSSLMAVNADTLSLVFWIMGTILGIWITLVVAGQEMRNQWFKAVMDHLPGW